MSHTVKLSESSITFRNILDYRTHSETSQAVDQTVKYADDLIHLQTSLSYHPHFIMLSMTNLPIEPSELSAIYIADVQLHYSSRPEIFYEKGVLRDFAKFTGKHLFQSLFYLSHRPATLLKKRHWHGCFLVNFAKFLRTLFLTEHLQCLLLIIKLPQSLTTPSIAVDYRTHPTKSSESSTTPSNTVEDQRLPKI